MEANNPHSNGHPQTPNNSISSSATTATLAYPTAASVFGSGSASFSAEQQSQSLSPSRTVITSFTPRRPRVATSTSPYEDGDWVMCMAKSNDQDTAAADSSVACALSNGQVQVYDLQRLHLVRSFAHRAPEQQQQSVIVNALTYGPQHSLLSAGDDGCVCLYDLRAQAHESSARVQLPAGQPATALALGYEGSNVLAIGSSKGRIHFCDIRNPQTLLGTYANSHCETVTVVQFSNHNNHNSVLLSGSDDGLLCLFDTTQPTEETALKSVMNVGAAIRKAGFCGGNLLYCLTSNETLGLWNGYTAAPATLPHAPHAPPAVWTRHDFCEATTTASSPVAWSSMDYLVDAHVDTTSGNLWLLAGGTTAAAPSSTGNSALFSLNLQQNNDTAATCWHHAESMVGGHCGVIRAWHPHQELFLTAGEDARLCEWRAASFSSSNNNNSATLSTTVAAANKKRGKLSPGEEDGGGGPLRRRQRHKTSSLSPY